MPSGGFNFDLKIAELLATRFNEVWGKKASGKGKDLRDFVRPMTRLRLEAVKIKEVLSANMEIPVHHHQHYFRYKYLLELRAT
jgi:molecular chaperone DnaK (HSP70)